MTILHIITCIFSAFSIGFLVCWLYLVAPLLQRNSRLIGWSHQKDYEITHWKSAWERVNNDFMKLAEIHNSVIKPEGELNDC